MSLQVESLLAVFSPQTSIESRVRTNTIEDFRTWSIAAAFHLSPLQSALKPSFSRQFGTSGRHRRSAIAICRRPRVVVQAIRRQRVRISTSDEAVIPALLGCGLGTRGLGIDVLRRFRRRADFVGSRRSRGRPANIGGTQLI